MPTISVENYLKTIYKLENRADDRVKTKGIADELDISLPSVTSMIKSLSDEGLVDYEKYRGVTLTDEGKRLALKVIRKHRLVELFLVETLGYAWDEVHAEAERLEHAISDELAHRMESFLSFPRFDPHGDPIPTADGTIHESTAIPLDSVEPGARVTMERVLDQDPEMLRYLERISLVPGRAFTVVERLPFDGQMFIELTEGAPTALSQALSTRIMVVVEDAS
ncbi:MAG: metal-dependent transcriptional regulator [Myxococcota bacterium]|jgi:DtxR family Mn-dependent transcriptional regulator|nr:metal-dependent transcriptional regulator [Myxococcota bacterium]MEC9441107.1 metal-dependent transcriptional regulator [Myxococcota bacterium]